MPGSAARVRATAAAAPERDEPRAVARHVPHEDDPGKQGGGERGRERLFVADDAEERGHTTIVPRAARPRLPREGDPRPPRDALVVRPAMRSAPARRQAARARGASRRRAGTTGTTTRRPD